MNEAPTAAGDLVYVRSSDYAWLPAKVLEVSDDYSKVHVQVQLPQDWEVHTVTKASIEENQWVDLKDYWHRVLPRRPAHGDKDNSDMAQLAHLSEATILYQLKTRHAHGQPYTRVGEIIVAVNPCQWITELYTDEKRQEYSKKLVWNADKRNNFEEKKEDGMTRSNAAEDLAGIYDRLNFEPHVYEASALAYRGITADGLNQAIIVSGESGAGKTETVKIVVQHLATTLSSTNQNSLAARIIQSSPILEAFGNAKTCRNDNSSRFGKVTRLHYDRKSANTPLVGSSYETYLLEKNRVVSIPPGEGTFHIFYQVLNGDDDFKSDMLGDEWIGATPADFGLGHGPANEGSMLFETVAAFKQFGIHSNELRELVQSLGIVLRLRNIEFEENENDLARVVKSEDLRLLERAIGIDAKVIEERLTSMTINVQDEEVNVPLSVGDAQEATAALAKCVYTIIFDHVVAQLNKHTVPPKANDSAAQIALIDIYGFESFEINRFEQLCINYANEKLQYMYVSDKLLGTRLEYELEGIEMFDTSMVDNSDIIDLFEGDMGVIECLNQECVRKKGFSKDFVYNLKMQNASHTKLLDKSLHTPTEFGIAHFAGPVTYTASDFVERNFDRLPSRLLALGKMSSNEIVKNGFARLFHEQEEDITGCPSNRLAKQSSIDKFRSNLKVLMSSMDGAQIRYIRCIKPNETMRPKIADHNTIMKQTICSGLVTAMDLSRESFPSSLHFKTVVQRFTCILPQSQQHCIKEIAEHDKVQIMMSTLFAPYIEKFQDSAFTMPFACGKTKVFFRSGALEVLEKHRQEHYDSGALVIQSAARMFSCKTNYRRVKKGVVYLQSCYRRNKEVDQLSTNRKSAIFIQSLYRCRKQRGMFTSSLQKIVRLQALSRSFLSRQRASRKEAAHIICLYIQRYQQKKNSSATLIAIWWRRFSSRMKIVARSAVVMQSMVRVWFAKRKILHAIDQKKTAGEPDAIDEEIAGELDAIDEEIAGEPDAIDEEEIAGDPDEPILFDRAESGSIQQQATDTDQKSVISSTSESHRSSSRYVWKHDAYVRRLENENKRYLEELACLRQVVNDVAAEAEKHNVTVECDFEDRLVDYEEEVLSLRKEIERLQEEKYQADAQLLLSEEKYQVKLSTYKRNLMKSHAANKEYLHKLHRVFDESNKARQNETERFAKEIREIRTSRDQEISQLRQEVERLRGGGVVCTDLVLLEEPNQLALHLDEEHFSTLVEAKQLVKDLQYLTAAETMVKLLKPSRKEMKPLEALLEDTVSQHVRLISTRLLEMVESADDSDLYI